MPATNDNLLGNYLKDRRTKLDPAALGFPLARRRTPGLRREEVAQRANVSATWYTWLEQGRGGAPSVEVLDRIARALMLADIEREHLFLLAFGRPPAVSSYQDVADVAPRIQHVLDALTYSPAFVRTATWDVIAWNRAFAIMFNYDVPAPEQRNVLRRMFCDPQVRAMNTDWESSARFVVAAFRMDTARAGATQSIKALVNDLCQQSSEFAAMWRDHDISSYSYSDNVKFLRHPIAGVFALEYSAFAVDGRPDLSMTVFTPTTSIDVERIRTLINMQSVRAIENTVLTI